MSGYGLEAELALRFEGRPTSVRCLRQDPPWKVVRGFPLPSGASLVHVNNVSGGIFGGDALQLSVKIEAEARAQVTTTGATRVYRPRTGCSAARLDACFTLGAGALLEYLPDALIPFRGSRVQQRTRFLLAEGATLFSWETIAPGRTAMGERFAYEQVKVASDIVVRGKPVLLDRLLLEPAHGGIGSPAAFGQGSYLVSFVAARAGSSAAELRLLEQVLRDTLASQDTHEDRWGVTSLPAHGVLVRGMVRVPANIPAVLSNLWSAAKQQLCGEPAEPPRKTY